MGNLIAIWIAIQLILCGSASISIHNKIVDKTYKCAEEDKVSPIYGYVIPLVAFVDATEIDKYCDQKK